MPYDLNPGIGPGNPFKPMKFPTLRLSIGPELYSFKGWLMVFLIFIQILIENTASKHCIQTLIRRRILC